VVALVTRECFALCISISSSLSPNTQKQIHHRYMQCHTNYLKLMGLPIGEGVGGEVIPSVAFLTYCAHVTRAKNSSPVM